MDISRDRLRKFASAAAGAGWLRLVLTPGAAANGFGGAGPASGKREGSPRKSFSLFILKDLRGPGPDFPEAGQAVAKPESVPGRASSLQSAVYSWNAETSASGPVKS